MAYEEETVCAKLVIIDFECLPDEITKILGIVPHKTWLRGDKRTPKASIRHESNGWLFATPLLSIQESNLEKQVGLLISIIEPAIDSFKNLPKNTKVQIYCPFYVNDPKSLVLGVSSQAIQVMAKIDASYLGIDLM